MNKIKKNRFIQHQFHGAGFTLIELIVVIAILGILATIGLTSFQTSQMKSRDARRKSDLEQVQRALEAYMNDYGNYPAANAGGIDGFLWGGEMKDAKDTLYMKQLPKDPRGNPEYCYLTVAATPYTYYKLYAKLENSEDPRIGGPYTCAGIGTYNYGVASSNATP